MGGREPKPEASRVLPVAIPARVEPAAAPVAIVISSDDRNLLARALGKSPNDPQVSHIAELVARAGAMELMAQATGQNVFSNISDLRSFRIYCLLSQGMGLRDAEALTSTIFKVNAAAARRLVSNAAARYSVQIESVMSEFAKTVLYEADEDPENVLEWRVRISTAALRERFDGLLRTKNLPGPSSGRLGGQLRYPDESYQALLDAYGLDPRPATKAKGKKKKA